ncbi:MAG: hypothetical protein RIS64_4248 [Bacteroidota bacterium]|jgi:hypothetical protein
MTGCWEIYFPTTMFLTNLMTSEMKFLKWLFKKIFNSIFYLITKFLKL